MPDADPQPSAASVAIARQLAAAHPGATLPCPVCPANLNATNLERHLAKVHAAELQAVAQAGPLRLRGSDRRMFAPMLGLGIAWVVAVLAVIVVTGGHLTGLEASILGGSGLVCLGLAGAASAGLFKATLELDGQQLRLRWLLGIASRTVQLPAKLESGTLMKRVISTTTYANENVDSEDVRAGAYLRLGAGATITVGAEKASGLGKHWAQKGWAKAKKTRRTDIDIDRAGLVALEYQLAARGQLMAKGG